MLEHRVFIDKAAIYLKLISEATLMKSQNEGTLRRDIWAYLLEIYGKHEDTVDYRDFLHSIRHLLQQGKLLNESGLFRVEPNTFNEIWDKPQTPCFNKSSATQPNPLITTRGARGAFSAENLGATASKQQNKPVQKNLHGGIANPFQQSLSRGGKSQLNLSGVQASYAQYKLEKYFSQRQQKLLKQKANAPKQETASKKANNAPVFELETREEDASGADNHQPIISASQPVIRQRDNKDEEMLEEAPTTRPLFFGFMTPVATNPQTAEPTGSKVKVESPITKLQIDNSRRRLNFPEDADSASEAGEVAVATAGGPDAAIEQNDDDLIVESLLAAKVEAPENKPSGKQSRMTDAALGTPSNVLGIHRNNGFAKKPSNREERIEMKNSVNGPSGTSNKKGARNKDLAPNSIKKSPVKSRGIVSEKKTQVRTSARKTTKQQLTSAKKEQRQCKQKGSKSPSRAKPIRGMQLYQFAETARTLRSAVNGANNKETTAKHMVLETPKKGQQPAKAQPVPILAKSKRISKRGQREQQNLKSYVAVKKQSEGKRVGFQTPTKKSKSFRQARLAVSGRKFKLYKGEDDYIDALTATADTTQKKRGRPRKQASPKIKFPGTDKRKAKVNASSVIKQLYSHSKTRGVQNQRVKKGDAMFYI